MRLHYQDLEGSDHLKRRLAREAKIFLNGKEAEWVLWADEEEGVLERYMSDAELRSAPPSNEYPTVLEYGDVEIRDPNGEYKRARQ